MNYMMCHHFRPALHEPKPILNCVYCEKCQHCRVREISKAVF